MFNESTSERIKLQLQKYQRDRVTLRVWTSGTNPNNTGESCGHVSVEINDPKNEKKVIYMSLWPKEPPNKDVEGFGLWKKIVEPEFLPNYGADLEYENRPPELTIYLYTLDPNAILKKFEEMKKTCGGWSILGLKNSESCATAAWLLLKAGDEDACLFSNRNQIRTASSQSNKGSFFSSVNSSSSQFKEGSKLSAYSIESAVLLFGIKSPDMLAEMAKGAQEEEERKSPLTIKLERGKEIKNTQKNCYIF